MDATAGSGGVVVEGSGADGRLSHRSRVRRSSQFGDSTRTLIGRGGVGSEPGGDHIRQEVPSAQWDGCERIPALNHGPPRSRRGDLFTGLRRKEDNTSILYKTPFFSF